MSIPVSTVPAVRAFLVSAITTQVNDSSVQVFNGVDGPDVEADVILVAGVQRQAQASALVGGGGQHFIEEHYQIEVRVSCFTGGDTSEAPTVDARAWALASSVETAVRNDLSLGGLVVVAKPGQSYSAGPQWEDDHKGVICDVFVVVDCFAQL